MTEHEAEITQSITVMLGYFVGMGGIAGLVTGNWALGIGLLVGSAALIVMALKDFPGCLSSGEDRGVVPAILPLPERPKGR